MPPQDNTLLDHNRNSGNASTNSNPTHCQFPNYPEPPLPLGSISIRGLLRSPWLALRS